MIPEERVLAVLAETKQRADDLLKNLMFEYLDSVRDSGVINMFGAGPYVQEEFGLSKDEAKDIVIEWMETFDARHPGGE